MHVDLSRDLTTVVDQIERIDSESKSHFLSAIVYRVSAFSGLKWRERSE